MLVSRETNILSGQRHGLRSRPGICASQKCDTVNYNATNRPDTVGAQARAALNTSGGVEVDFNFQRLNRLATLGALSATAAHEIKNAMVPVRTFIDLLLEEKPDSELGAIVRRELQRINLLLGQMLKLAAPAPPQLLPVSLHVVIGNSLCLLRHQASLRSVTVNCQLDAVSDQVLGDGNQLEQVLLNLLINALEAVPERGSVTVSTRTLALERLIEIVVADNGRGISTQDMVHLFEPFFTTKQGGTGLGLSIVRQIVSAHKGDIEADSSPGMGATFCMRFPLAPSK